MLTFDDEKHEYWDDGIKLPSVTEICRFAHGGIYESVQPHLRDAAARRGTMIHELCTQFDIDGEVECPPELAGYLKAYADFKRDYRVREWIWFEKMVGGNAYGYAGTLDRAGMVEGALTILDIKTGSKIDKLLLLAQLCGYKNAAELERPIERLMGLQLKRDGKYRVYDFPFSDLMQTNPFNLCYLLYKHREELQCRVKKA